MVLGLLVIAGIPTTIGVAEAVSAQKKQNAAEKEKAKFQMMVKLSIDQGPAEDCWVVLVGGRVRIQSLVDKTHQPHLNVFKGVCVTQEING